jgi:uncharacterized membrane protein YhaH (DUF805 family)
MDMSMFTGFEGRINRAKWWLGTIILVIAGVILWWIIARIFGASMMPADPASARTLAVVQLITFVILVYPWLSLITKRLNDRDRPQWYAYVFLAPSVLGILLGLLGLTIGAPDATTGAVTPTSLGWILNLLTIAVGIWMLVELGILKGTTGPNQHGPDPLGG